MRLIDADALIKEFDPNGERLDPILVRSRIVQQPTAYNVEKVVAELEEESFEYQRNNKFGKVIGIECAIDIVRKGGVE